MGKLFSWKELTGHDVSFESDRNVVRVTFSLRNNIDNSTIGNASVYPKTDTKTLQEQLGKKLGVKCSVIVFLNDKLGEKLGIIAEECQKLQCKLGVNHSVNHSVNIEANKLSILLLIVFHPRITRMDIANILDITVSTTDYHIQWLRKKGYLVRVGADKNGYWQLNLDERENDED